MPRGVFRLKKYLIFFAEQIQGMSGAFVEKSVFRKYLSWVLIQVKIYLSLLKGRKFFTK
jgi:hypothetical protein